MLTEDRKQEACRQEAGGVGYLRYTTATFDVGANFLAWRGQLEGGVEAWRCGDALTMAGKCDQTSSFWVFGVAGKEHFAFRDQN